MYKMGHYIPGDSPVHRLDPRVKIGSVIVLSIMVLKGGLVPLSMISLSLLAVILVSGVPLQALASGLRPILFFVLLFFWVHLLFTPGKAIPPFPLWIVTITREGLLRGMVVSWQFMLLVLSGVILTMTTPPSEFVSGIEKLLRPLKVLRIPSHDVALMISIALRFVPGILSEIDRMKEAQTARGANFRTGSLAERGKAYLSLLIPLTFRTLNRADNLVTAMEGRGYERGMRTYLRELRLRSPDYAAMVLMTLAAGLYML